MKNLKLFSLFILAIAFSMTSCSNDNDPISAGENLNCLSPSSLTAVAATAGVTIAWTAVGDEATWEIQYGEAGFAVYQGTTVTATENPFVLTGLTPGTSYDIYVRSLCSDSEHSVWVGPVTVTSAGTAPVDPTIPPVGTYDFMNANVNGVQFNNMKPLGYGFTNGTTVHTWGDDNEFVYLKMQADSNQTPLVNGEFEINLYIPEAQWLPGTYPLIDNNDSSHDGADSSVHYIRLESYSVSVIISNGTITVSEFDETARRIKGTFSYDYTVTDANENVSEVRHVTGGTFDYPLDDEYFD